MLRLEAESGPSAEAVSRAIEIVAGVELHAGLGRGDVERSAAHGIGNVRSMTEISRPRADVTPSVDHERVVVSVPAPNLLVAGIDSPADFKRHSKIERGAD